VDAARKLDYVSVDDYLAAELTGRWKHEYVGGFVYAMAGARNAHNQIASNILVAAGGRLRGTRCRAFNSDTKVRIRLPNHLRFYYPDLQVVCHPNPGNDSFQDQPSVVVEVLSRGTRRLDEGEKKDAYCKLPSLSVYLLIEQERARAIAYRRTDHGFVPEVYEGVEATVPLPEVGIELPLVEVYDGIEFTPEEDPPV